MANKKKGLVIVESPAKAKKINSFLGSDYTVLASMGHVCDLPQGADQIPDDVKKAQPWTKLGVNVDNDFEPYYVVPKEKEKTVRELVFITPPKSGWLPNGVSDPIISQVINKFWT